MRGIPVSSMKRFLLPLLPFLICTPASAAEVELWQGLWSGMTKGQVEKRLKVPYVKCESEGTRLYCDSSRRLTLGDEKAVLRNMFDKGRLSAVSLVVSIRIDCKSNDEPGRTREQIVADARAYIKCLETYEAKDKQQLEVILAALRAKYGEPTSKSKLTNLPEWSIKGIRIALSWINTGNYAVSYRKDDTYGSL